MVYWGEYNVGCLPGLILMIIQTGILCKWANDGQQFLLEHLDIIHESPSHIYHSALPLSPPSTWLQEHYSSELSQEVRVVEGLPVGWGIHSRTVSLGTDIQGISYWDNTVAIGSWYRDIIILDATTGTQTAILSGHNDKVNSVVFSSDGRSLVSGSDDKTVKLWDLQTGGTIKTFFGHTDLVFSVSISVDSATIASGSFDKTVQLWDTQTGECCCIIEQPEKVYLVKFSPTDPQHFLSKSNHQVWQWNINGHQVGPTFNGHHADFSPDGAQLVSYYEEVATIQHPSSGAVIVKFPVIEHDVGHSCFSPDGRIVAIATGSTIYVWDTTDPELQPVGPFVGHTNIINSLAFSSPSSLISASSDQSVRFWKISAQSIGQAGTDPKSISLTLTIIMSVTILTKDDISITSDSDGVVKTWDIFTGFNKTSFQTPAKAPNKRDVQVINGRLVLAWHRDQEINIWDVEKGELFLTVDAPEGLEDIKISEDGSRVFSVGARVIQSQSIQTGKIVGKAGINIENYKNASLTVNGSRVWVHYPNAETQVWDFGTQESSPIQLLSIPLYIFHPNGAMLWDTSLSHVREKTTGKVVFWLPQNFGKPVDVQWNDEYLAASFISGEVLVLDFGYVLPQ